MRPKACILLAFAFPMRCRSPHCYFPPEGGAALACIASRRRICPPRSLLRQCSPLCLASSSSQSWMQRRHVGFRKSTRHSNSGYIFSTKSGSTHGDTPVHGSSFASVHRPACSTDGRTCVAACCLEPLHTFARCRESCALLLHRGRCKWQRSWKAAGGKRQHLAALEALARCSSNSV